MDRAISEIAESFGLKPQRIIKSKYFYIVHCNEGEYRVYATGMSENEITTLSEIKLALMENGILTDVFLNSDGNPFFKCENDTYIALKMIKGDSFCLESNSNILKVAEAIGNLHNTLKQFETDNTKSLSEVYIKGLNRMKQIKNIINRKNKNTVADTLFINNFDFVVDACKATADAVKSLENASENTYIHGSLKEENIVINHNVAFINWGGLKVDTPLKDLAYFINRYVKKFALEAKRNNQPYISFGAVVEAYGKGNCISSQELSLLKALVLYPEKYVKVVGDYYKHPKPFTPVYIKDKIQESIEISRFLVDYVEE